MGRLFSLPGLASASVRRGARRAAPAPVSASRGSVGAPP